MKRRAKELALIVVAGGLLVFELVAIAGALPIVRRAISRASHPSVRVIEVNHPRRGPRANHRPVATSGLSCRMAEVVKHALL